MTKDEQKRLDDCAKDMAAAEEDTSAFKKTFDAKKKERDERRAAAAQAEAKPKVQPKAKAKAKAKAKEKATAAPRPDWDRKWVRSASSVSWSIALSLK